MNETGRADRDPCGDDGLPGAGSTSPAASGGRQIADALVQYFHGDAWYRIRMAVSERIEGAAPCGLMRRIGAMTYDGLVLVALWMLAAAVVVVLAGGSIDSGNPWFRLYLLGVAFAYLHLCWSRLGQTLGMRTWRIRLEPDRRPLSLARSALRFAAGLASLATLGLGFAWALFRADRRAWPDLASGTRLRVDRR